MVVEVALSIVLLTGAGLMIRSFYELTHIDLGFNAKNLFFAPVGLRLARKDARSNNKATQVKPWSLSD